MPKQSDDTVLPVRPGGTVFFGVSMTARRQGHKLYSVTDYPPITAVPVRGSYNRRMVPPASGFSAGSFSPAQKVFIELSKN